MFENQSLTVFMRSHWLLLLIIVLFSPLFFVRLAESPNSWYDEGLNINAAQTFADTGVFGLTTGTGIRASDPAIQTGPPLIVLMAIVIKVVNQNLVAIRLVMVVIGILTLISLYGLAYRIYGQFAAFLLALMLFVMPITDTTSSFIFLSRQFLGEIPAVLCICLGCHLLLRSRPTFISYAFIGIFWGLAVIIKSQVLLVLSITVVIWVLYRLITNKQDKFYWVLTAVVMFGLYGLDTLWRSNMAGSNLADNLTVLREGIPIHILPFRTVKNLYGWTTIARLAVSGFTFGAVWFLQRPTTKPSLEFQQQPQPHRSVQNFILLLIGIWMFWYGFVSIGWSRYSFVGLIFTFVILSGVGSAIWSLLKIPINRYISLGLLILALVCGYLFNIPALKDATGDDFFKIVDYIKTQLPADTRIVSVDWATDNFVPQHFILPPTHIINAVTENAFVKHNPDYVFDSLEFCPQYVLLGSLRLDSEILKTALKISATTPLFHAGIYDLYKVNTDQLPATCATTP